MCHPETCLRARQQQHSRVECDQSRYPEHYRRLLLFAAQQRVIRLRS